MTEPEPQPGPSTGRRPPAARRTHTTARDLERYSKLFAKRTAVMRSSAMRDLMEITARPEVISLAGGLPDTSTFPPQSFAAQMTRIAQTSSAQALQYGPTEGFSRTKNVVREVMRAEGMEPDLDDILITTGGQQAIDLVCKALIDPGDVVIAEAPTYPGAVPTFTAYEAELIQIEVDDAGMRIDLLADALERLAAAGREPKMIYTIPTFQNPAGVTMAAERRRALVDLARARELLVVEDNPYGLLRYEGEPLDTLYRLDGGDYVIYLGTLSKILSPGIRLGWVCAPPPITAKLVIGKQASDLCTSTLSQYFACEWFEEGRWLPYIDDVRGIYLHRRDVMLEALERWFPEQATWSHPAGGLFLWATLPSYINTTDLLARALRDNVAFVPGSAAFLDGRGTDSMRLNFSGVTDDEIREGVRRIGAVISEQMALYETLTQPGRPVAEAAEPGKAGDVVPITRPRPDPGSQESPGPQ